MSETCHETDLTDVNSDRASLELLRQKHQGTRGCWRTYCSLKAIQGIKFVRREMYRSDFADILRVNDLPPENRNHEYQYPPILAKLILPVGEN